MDKIKKKGQAVMEFLMTYGWAILAAIIVIGVLGVYFWNNWPKDEWIIEIEECKNVTEVVGEKLIKSYNKTYPYKIRSCDSDGIFDEFGASEEFIRNEFPNCDTDYCHYNYWKNCKNPYCVGVEYKIWREEFVEKIEDFEPIEDTRIICKHIEVDEIIYETENIKTATTGMWLEYNEKNNCSLIITSTTSGYRDIKNPRMNGDTCRFIVNITRENLNKKWLEENCECIKDINYNCTEEFKCFNKYHVRIK